MALASGAMIAAWLLGKALGWVCAAVVYAVIRGRAERTPPAEWA